VRARNILRKLGERGEKLPDFRARLGRESMARQLADENCWQLLLAASKVDSAVERAVASGEAAHVARYAFQLAQSFSNFYHEYPVLSETNAEKKTFLLWMTECRSICRRSGWAANEREFNMLRPALEPAAKSVRMEKSTGPECRNWQTNRTQNPAHFTGRVGSSPTSGTTISFLFSNSLPRLF
jgi:hypothetical protein